ncbi:unnamed protein product, partial [Musa textilis]
AEGLLRSLGGDLADAADADPHEGLRSLGGDLTDAADANPHEGRAGGWGRPALYQGGDGGVPPVGESRLDERCVPVGD